MQVYRYWRCPSRYYVRNKTYSQVEWLVDSLLYFILKWNSYKTVKQIYQPYPSKSIAILRVSIITPESYSFRQTLTDHKIHKLLKILTPLEPLKRHQDVKFARTKNTGTWLLSLESFSQWRDSNTTEEGGNVFCCYGIPGAGKTVIRYLVKTFNPISCTRRCINN